jgi:hypothetical protein
VLHNPERRQYTVYIGLCVFGGGSWHDVLAVVLAGFVFANTFPALDSDLGGNASDPWSLGAVSVLATVGLLAGFGRYQPRHEQAESFD